MGVGVEDININIVVVFDVKLPAFKPFKVYQIADIFFFLSVVNHIPTVKMSH